MPKFLNKMDVNGPIITHPCYINSDSSDNNGKLLIDFGDIGLPERSSGLIFIKTYYIDDGDSLEGSAIIAYNLQDSVTAGVISTLASDNEYGHNDYKVSLYGDKISITFSNSSVTPQETYINYIAL